MTKNAVKTVPARAAIYCRLSQDRTGESLGIDRQEKLCRKLATERGWTVAGIYVDRDISAFKETRRPEFERMREDVRTGQVDGVLAVDQDRISRRLSVLAGLIDEFAKYDVPIAVASGEIDTTTTDGVLKAQMLGMIAENESRRKSDRIKRQREQHAEAGRPHPGRRAFGYAADGISIVKHEAEIVREGVRRFIAGESMRSIALEWNRRGVPSARGGQWTTQSLRVLLANPRYAALRVHRGEVIGDATWEPIITRADHDAVVSILGDPRRTKRGRPGSRLLSSVLRCGLCGGTLYVSTRSDGAFRYMCSPTPGSPNCGRIAVAAEPIEAVIEAAVLHRLDTPAVATRVSLKKVPKRPKADDPVRIERDLESLSAAFGAGEISRREWLAARRPLAARLDACRNASVPDTSAIDGIRGRGARQRWAGLDIDGRRRIVVALIDTVVVKPATVRGRRAFDADRLNVVWKV